MSTSSDNKPSHSPLKDAENPHTFKGACHCGKFAFELRHPALDDGVEVVSCNCSICAQRGYLFIYTLNPDQDFKLTKGTRAELSEYRFNRCEVAHRFCPVCGSGIFEEAKRETGHMVGVNVRTIPGLDLDSLTLKKENGRDEL